MNIWIVEKIEIDSNGTTYTDRRLFSEKNEKIAKKYFKKLVSEQIEKNKDLSGIVYDDGETYLTCYEEGRAAEWRVDIMIDLLGVEE